MEGRDRRTSCGWVQGVHWSEGVSRAHRALESQAGQFEDSVFVQAPERIPPDRGRGGSWAIRLVGHDDKLRDVLREKSARSAFKNIQTFLRMLEWQLMKCAGSLGFLWGDEAKGIAGRMFGDGPFFATPKPQRSSICKLTPPASRLPAALSTFRFHPSSFILPTVLLFCCHTPGP